MMVKAQKVGNSMMVTIPKKILESFKINKGDELELNLKSDQELTIQKKKKKNIKDFKGFLSGSKNKFTLEEEIEFIKKQAAERYKRSLE